MCSSQLKQRAEREITTLLTKAVHSVMISKNKFQTWRSTSTFKYVLKNWWGGKDMTCIVLLY